MGFQRAVSGPAAKSLSPRQKSWSAHLRLLLQLLNWGLVFLATVFAATLLATRPVESSDVPVIIKDTVFPKPAVEEKKPATRRGNETYRPLSDSIALAHGVDKNKMWNIVICESGGDPNADNPTSTATGLVQILLSAHPDITLEQALDPRFSLEYLATQLSLGRQSMWECYTKLYGTQKVQNSNDSM